MKYIIMILLSAFLLCACSEGKYQIVTAPDGNKYRLDTSSGEVYVIRGNAVEKLPAKDFYLKIGQRYTGEDMFSFTYLGKGKIGDIKTLN